MLGGSQISWQMGIPKADQWLLLLGRNCTSILHYTLATLKIIKGIRGLESADLWVPLICGLVFVLSLVPFIRGKILPILVHTSYWELRSFRGSLRQSILSQHLWRSVCLRLGLPIL